MIFIFERNIIGVNKTRRLKYMKNSKKYILPAVALIVSMLLALILTFPMSSMEIKDIPIGIVSADAGTTTPAGKVNAGDKVVKELTEADNTFVEWKVCKTEAEAESEFNDGSVFATVVIPENFTAANMAGQDCAVKATVNEGRNVVIANAVNQMIAAMSQKSGMNIEIETVNPVSQYGMKAMMLPAVLILITFICSVATGYMTANCFRFGDEHSRWKKYILQLVYVIPVAFAVGYAVTGAVKGITGIALPAGDTGLYLSLISAAVMLITGGAVNLFKRKGLAIPAVILVFGMALIQIPSIFLPKFWQIIIASWEPMRYFGQGLREVAFMNNGIGSSAAAAIAVVGLTGIALSLIAAVRKEKSI